MSSEFTVTLKQGTSNTYEFVRGSVRGEFTLPEGAFANDAILQWAAANEAKALASEAEALASKAEMLSATLHTTVDRVFVGCNAFNSNAFALGQSTSANASNSASSSASASSSQAARPTQQGVRPKIVTTLADLIGDGFVDTGDNDDEKLVNAMNEWFQNLKGDDDGFSIQPKKAIKVNAALVAKVLGYEEGAGEVKDVQPVMCSLLVHYFRTCWSDETWLHFYAERLTRDMGDDVVTTNTTSARRFDGAAVASDVKIGKVDAMGRASTVMSFEFKPPKAAAAAKRLNDVATGQSVKDAAAVLREWTPGTETPCVFAFAGTPGDFDLLCIFHDFVLHHLVVRRFNVKPAAPNARALAKKTSTWSDAFDNQADVISLLKPIHAVMSHIVRNHPLTASAKAAPGSAAAPALWRMPTPLLIRGNFDLPKPVHTTNAVLSLAFKAFDGSPSLSWPVGNFSFVFVSVVAATERRLLMRVNLGDRQLVFKFAYTASSADRECDRVGKICEVFAGDDMAAHREHVRLPIGYISGIKPVLVSDVWPGHSLARGVPADSNAREKVRNLLESQIWPVIDALAAKDIYYVDLHAGNVMVDDALAKAWLIDFEGAIAAGSAAGSNGTTQLVADASLSKGELSAHIQSQKEALLAKFKSA